MAINNFFIICCFCLAFDGSLLAYKPIVKVVYPLRLLSFETFFCIY